MNKNCCFLVGLQKQFLSKTQMLAFKGVLNEMTALNSPGLNLGLNDTGVTTIHISFIYWGSYSSLLSFHKWCGKGSLQRKWDPQKDALTLSVLVFLYKEPSDTATLGLLSVAAFIRNPNFPRGAMLFEDYLMQVHAAVSKAPCEHLLHSDLIHWTSLGHPKARRCAALHFVWFQTWRVHM